MSLPPFLAPEARDHKDVIASGRTCLLVLGMHRSGTSAMTRVLSIAGAKLPATLLGAGKGNEAGHWNSAAIAAYNDQLLSQLGTRWWDWRPVDITKLPISRRQEIKAEIADLLSSEYGDAPLFVVKDPRVCRFAPLFLDVLDDMGVEARIVHIVRNPLEVADSLERADPLVRLDGMLRWLRNALDSEAATRGRLRIILSDSALLNGHDALRKISDGLPVTEPNSLDEITDQVAKFLDGSLKHNIPAADDLSVDRALHHWIGDAYSSLLMLERNNASPDATTTLDAIRREFDRAVPILKDLLVEMRDTGDRQQRDDPTIEHLMTALAERDAEITDLKSALRRETRQGRLWRATRLTQLSLVQQTLRSHQEIIEEFRNSTSWKVTRPLRALKDALPILISIPKGLKKIARGMVAPSQSEAIIRESGLFNTQYYLAQIPAENVANPIDHYLRWGSKKGISPNPLFDAEYYCTHYARHVDIGLDPFVHFIQFGSRHGFDPSRLFQSNYYLESNPDAQKARISPLQHYLAQGRVEGRMPVNASPSDLSPIALRAHQLDLTSESARRFDDCLYADLYPEIAAADGPRHLTMLAHYEAIGRAEGRIGTLEAFFRMLKQTPEAVPVDFDATRYLEINNDLVRDVPQTFYSALKHYLQRGLREKREYTHSQCYIDASWHDAAELKHHVALSSGARAKTVGCLVHVGDAQVWPAIHASVSRLGSASSEPFVSVPMEAWSEGLHSEIRDAIPRARIVISEGHDGDVAGLAHALAGVDCNEYAAFVVIEAGKSDLPVRRGGGAQPTALPESLGQRIDEYLALVTAGPNIGVISVGIGPGEGKVSEVVGSIKVVNARVLEGLCDAYRDRQMLGPEESRLTIDEMLAEVSSNLGYRVCRA